MAAQRGPNQMQDFMRDVEPKKPTAGPNAPADPSQRGEVVDMRLFGDYMQDVPSEVGNTSTPAVYTEPAPADPSQRGQYTDQIKDTVTQESEGYSPTGNIYNPGYTGPDGSNSGQFDQGSALGSLNDSDVYLGSHTGNSENPAQDATTGSAETAAAAAAAAQAANHNAQTIDQQYLADNSMEYLTKQNLLNTPVNEEIYQMEEYIDANGNKAKRPMVDPITGEPLLKTGLQSSVAEASRGVVDEVIKGSAAQVNQAGDVVSSDALVTGAARSDSSFSSAASAQAYLATFTEGKAITSAEHQNIKAAEDVIAREFEASLIPISEVGKSLDKLRDLEPMKASSVAVHMNELLSEMENGNVPLWARPAVTKVEQSLAGRGIGASSIGRDSLFNAIISAAMPIAQSDANLEQDSNKTNYTSRVQALFNDEAQIFAAKQFNATSINQTNQFISNLKAQVDISNASRKDAMSQFNSSQRNQVNMFNTQQINEMEKLNTSERNATARANAQMQTNVSTANAQMQTQSNIANAEISGRFDLADAEAANRAAISNADRSANVAISNRDAANRVAMANAELATKVSLENASMANLMAQHQSTLDANREQFNTQQANIVAQADVKWRRDLNTAETVAINAANEANVANAFNLSTKAQQNLWQVVRDEAHWAEIASENEKSLKHEAELRLLEADIQAGWAEGAAEGRSAWDKAKDEFLNKQIDASVDWLFND